MFTKFSSNISNILAIIFMLFTFWRSLPWQQVNKYKFFLYFFSFFCNIASFFRWKCFKICIGNDIDLKLLIPFEKWYFSTFEKSLIYRVFEKIELERYNLCLELSKLLKNLPKGTQDIRVHFWAFLRKWRHTFPDYN